LSSIDFVPSRLALRWSEESLSEDDEERASLWSVYFHRFFGEVAPVGEAPFEYSPMSQDDSCRTLYRLEQKRRVEPEMVERCVSQMLVAGYRPAHDCVRPLEHLSRTALSAASLEPAEALTEGSRRRGPRDALERMWWRARARYDEVAAQAMIPEDAIAAAPSHLGLGTERVMHLVAPTEIRYEGSAVTVTKEVWARRDLRSVGPRIDPRRWSEISLFITDTRRYDVEEDEEARGGWRGTLAEQFRLNWNQFRYSSFNVKLHVDYTESEGQHKADYRLAYEEDDQLQRDDGFVMAEKVAGYPGWTHYKMEKSVKFASAFQNFLVPAVIAMWVEQDTDDFLAREGRARRGPRTREAIARSDAG